MRNVDLSPNQFQPILTHYKGYRFRSRLEARWAFAFDVMKFEWAYEPEGFDLGDGIWYLPDFLLYEEMWVEIKGTSQPDEATLRKCQLLALHTKKQVALFAGNIGHHLTGIWESDGTLSREGKQNLQMNHYAASKLMRRAPRKVRRSIIFQGE